MKTTFHLLFSIILIAFCSLAANAQRQTALYVDDGHGNFSIIQAALGGGMFTLPGSGSSLTFPATNASGALTNDGTGSLSWAASSGFTPAFFNAYTTFVPFTIPPGGEIPVTTVATISGFVGDLSGGYTVLAAGTYNVEYTVSRDEPSALAISVNGFVTPNSVFGCATGTTVIHGNAILTLNALDVIHLIAASTNFVAITLESLSPFTTVEASMTAIRIQ